MKTTKQRRVLRSFEHFQVTLFEEKEFFLEKNLLRIETLKTKILRFLSPMTY